MSLAVVLCVGINPPKLVETRKMMLEQAGHTALTALSEHQAVQACTSQAIDVQVIGQRIPRDSKRKLLALFREHCPTGKILELYEAPGEAVLSEADDWLLVPTEDPNELVQHVNRLAELKTRESASD